MLGIAIEAGLIGFQFLGQRANKKLFNIALRSGVGSLSHGGKQVSGAAARNLATSALGNKKLFNQLYASNRGMLNTLGKRSAQGGNFGELVGTAYNPVNPIDFAGGFIGSAGSRIPGTVRKLRPMAGQNLGRSYRMGTTVASGRFSKVAGTELAVHTATRNAVRGASNMAMAFTMLSLGGMAVSWLPGMWDQVPDAQQELMAGTQYIMPRVAYTQRQRGLQAIHMSQMNTYSAFGNEASYMHQ